VYKRTTGPAFKDFGTAQGRINEAASETFSAIRTVSAASRCIDLQATVVVLRRPVTDHPRKRWGDAPSALGPLSSSPIKCTQDCALWVATMFSDFMVLTFAAFSIQKSFLVTTCDHCLHEVDIKVGCCFSSCHVLASRPVLIRSTSESRSLASAAPLPRNTWVNHSVPVWSVNLLLSEQQGLVGRVTRQILIQLKKVDMLLQQLSLNWVVML
jgi:hypothetical protein